MKSLISSIRRNIRGLVAPKHNIAMPPSLWRALVADLVERGEGVRESGAFLLGMTSAGRREVISHVLYDDLEPGCLDEGYVNFTSVGLSGASG